ncbi:AbrB/MazE/SpoVT family DNA-binding domain-containing protein [Xylophilus sp. ASV27]|uniref:AbrB/MazE/SpoVT family DNA-binding domain-containing protein n=1 Tax=Xylophilus sp. ASV27 TaxID=2795129 RepID=UPI0018EA5278|nr:AbrB/MazE/SpoVT family DNA-binding domain-containing protein [Xylophilus sp. ASV27]
MEIAIRTIGNSKGVVLPKPLLAQVGLDDQVTASVVVENGNIVLSKPAKHARAGWAAAAAALAAKGGDVPLMDGFGNESDAELEW